MGGTTGSLYEPACRELVSNLDQDASADEFAQIGNFGAPATDQHHAASFVAGPHNGGYNLHGARINVFANVFEGGSFTGTIKATIHDDNGGEPRDSLGTLGKPRQPGATRTAAINNPRSGLMTVHAASPISLTQGATYWLVTDFDLGVDAPENLYVQLTKTDSAALDQCAERGWRVSGNEYVRDTATSDWTAVVSTTVLQFAIIGEPVGQRSPQHEPACSDDLPGDRREAHLTTGMVTPGTVSTGHLTAGLDTNLAPDGIQGFTGDHWFLDTQPGRSYRLEVKFGDNPGVETGRNGRIRGHRHGRLPRFSWPLKTPSSRTRNAS